MSDKRLTIEERRAQRAKFLEILYDAVHGDPSYYVKQEDIGAEMGLEYKDCWEIRSFLAKEGLIEGMGGVARICITHKGAELVEEWHAGKDDLFRRDEPPIGDTINIGTAINSQIQQGTSGSSQEMTVSDQTIGDIESFVAGLKEEIGTLREAGLDEEAADEVEAQATIVEGQLASKKTRWDVVKDALTEIKTVLDAAKEIGGTVAPWVAKAAALIAGL